MKKLGPSPATSTGSPLLKHTASNKLFRTFHLNMKGHPRKTYTTSQKPKQSGKTIKSEETEIMQETEENMKNTY